MSTASQGITTGHMRRQLYVEKFFALSRQLQTWRLDPYMQQMDATKAEGRILGFVKGLRFSAQLAYLVRDVLSEENVEVSWGHLIDESGDLCSPECDVIIHRPGFVQRWNGGSHPIMDFKFINCSQALAIISCKSFTNSIDKRYCPAFAKHGIQRVVLFAECCKLNRVRPLRAQALTAGYKGLFYLYTVPTKDDFTVTEDPEVYVQFIELIKELVNPQSGTSNST